MSTIDKQIERVRRKIITWRKNKPFTTARIPSDIRAEIVKLTRKHSIAHVAKQLDVSNYLVKRWRGDLLDQRQSKSPADFIEVTNPISTLSPVQTSGRAIEISRPDGILLRVCGSFNESDLVSTARSLISELQRQ